MRSPTSPADPQPADGSNVRSGYGRHFVRPLPHRARVQGSMLRRSAPLGWELVAAPLVLIGYPTVAGGLGWSAAFGFIPDLSLSVLVVAGLAVLTGLARVLRLVTTRTTATPAPPFDARPDSAEPGFSLDVVAEDTIQLSKR